MEVVCSLGYPGNFNPRSCLGSVSTPQLPILEIRLSPIREGVTCGANFDYVIYICLTVSGMVDKRLSIKVKSVALLIMIPIR